MSDIPASRSTVETVALYCDLIVPHVPTFPDHHCSSAATEAPVSGVQRPVKPACLNCKGRVPLMRTGLCESCDSVPIMREAYASEIAAILSCG